MSGRKKYTKTDCGKTIECKFCRRAVWWDKIAGAAFELIGDELHIDHCPRRKAHMSNQASMTAQNKRNTR